MGTVKARLDSILKARDKEETERQEQRLADRYVELKVSVRRAEQKVKDVKETLEQEKNVLKEFEKDIKKMSLSDAFEKHTETELDYCFPSNYSTTATDIVNASLKHLR